MIIITGASDGLGKEVARLYKLQNAFVVNISLDSSEYADVDIITDLSKTDDVNAAVTEILAMEKSIEILINCAGVWSDEALGDYSDTEIDRLFAINNKGQMLLTSGLIDKIRNDKTDILNVASIAGTEHGSENGIYSVSKWAARGFTKHLQQNLVGTGCRVISFCPDGFQSTLMQKVNGKSSSDRTDLMPLASVALCLKQLLDLPKSIEVSEIILKKTRKK